MPKCVECDEEVIISPAHLYVYVYINIGMSGKEKVAYVHLRCFDKAIKKRSDLSKIVNEALIEATCRSLTKKNIRK